MCNTISTTVKTDSITQTISKIFDYEFNGTTTFTQHTITIDRPFNVGLIVGASGSGKSILLKRFGAEESPKWVADRAVASHFLHPQKAQNALMGVGFNSIPSWLKPYHVLSNGEKYRADLARRLKNGAVVDEFTSVVDRNVAKSCANAVRRYIDAENMHSVVFASCHFDIVEWLRPDWVYNTDNRELSWGLLQRPPIQLKIYEGSNRHWEMFKHHHYLTHNMHRAARCFVAVWEDTLVGFASTLNMPSGNLKNAYRGSRTVVLPDFQGLGIGARLSDAVAQIHIDEGKRFFSRTAHPRLGQYRESSPLWRPTSKNRKLRTDMETGKAHNSPSIGHYIYDTTRICFSHEYIGD